MVIVVSPHLVPYKKWKSDHQNLQVNDIVHVLYDRKVAKGTYRLGRILAVHADTHGTVRTVLLVLDLKTGEKQPYRMYLRLWKRSR